ncbi:hypothetical protein SAMN05660909_04168 [Chitinophaga terrae (ex Kim and Jung 2007)]|uniref:Uncharacterized protein n=1 Tax=Chitinophaga terrae (ex Kim and Jung 2007) TaxID=408074 RepID=A0A1H4F4H2_9BACT|nr:hypothetical protein [Chitinophaga terrae (ex Kim and Jung 2007)]MDQ0106514.1 preprotein translocase subunit SecG [Chitinophaga terrae (ex Kim and Jung 2007)]GEP92002.1 hypothetical protein CTE07_36470 [Chitinophaga terrae (ex Kim and Jung 2007)]SEA92235.1 hypothetical protein SAMN05660909_04168 [Chitinophaga terrae (ex Kim and Jung 2007)]
MKRTISILTFSLLSCAAKAQSNTYLMGDKEISSEFMRSIIIITILFIFSSFILSLIRLILDSRLKKQMIEKGVPPEVIINMLPRKNELGTTIKWFCLLTAISVGLLIITLSLPLGIHSVVIMGFSVAGGLLAYYFWAKKTV